MHVRINGIWKYNTNKYIITDYGKKTINGQNMITKLISVNHLKYLVILRNLHRINAKQ